MHGWQGHHQLKCKPLMYPNADILEFLFATVATIVATLTGLIGAFSTFRLQKIVGEIQLLKGLLLQKQLPNGKIFNDYVKGDSYYLREKIYDLDMDSIFTLEKLVTGNKLETQLNELMLDIDNIKRNQVLHDQIESVSISGFINSLAFVFCSLALLIGTNGLIATGQWLWLILAVYMFAVAYVLRLFIKGLKHLV